MKINSLYKTLFLVSILLVGIILFNMVNKDSDQNPLSLSDGKLVSLNEMGENNLTDRTKEASFDNEGIANEIIQYYEAMYADKQNQKQSVLSALGAISGFGCQMAIRKAVIEKGVAPENKAFVIIGTKSGQNFYFGDLLNEGLFNTGQISVWTLVAGGAIKAGATPESLPDITDIIKYNSSTVGSIKFGLPRLAKENHPTEYPHAALKKSWADIQNILEKNNIDPTFWGWLPANAAQYAIINYADEIPPHIAAKIVMESALPMSKVDPNTLK